MQADRAEGADEKLLIFTVSDEALEKADNRGADLPPNVPRDDVHQRCCGWSRLKKLPLSGIDD
jgi:hypothetical protein